MTQWETNIEASWPYFLIYSNVILMTPADDYYATRRSRLLTNRGQTQCQKLNQVLLPLLPSIHKNAIFLWSDVPSELQTLMMTFKVDLARLAMGPHTYLAGLEKNGYQHLIQEDKKIIHCTDAITMQLALLSSGGPSDVFHNPAEPLETIFVKIFPSGAKILARLSCLEGISGPTVH